VILDQKHIIIGRHDILLQFIFCRSEFTVTINLGVNMAQSCLLSGTLYELLKSELSEFIYQSINIRFIYHPYEEDEVRIKDNARMLRPGHVFN
jgi:hypothetical protein